MVKTINVGIYDIIKKDLEKGCLWDILICKCCNQTIQRSNFSRHKKSPKHTKLIEPFICSMNEASLPILS